MPRRKLRTNATAPDSFASAQAVEGSAGPPAAFDWRQRAAAVTGPLVYQATTPAYMQGVQR